MKKLQSIIQALKTNSPVFGAMYILPNGDILDLTVFEYGHLEFWTRAAEQCPDIPQENGQAKKYFQELGWLRLNTKVGYIEFPHNPITGEQEKIIAEMKARGWL